MGGGSSSGKAYAVPAQDAGDETTLDSDHKGVSVSFLANGLLAECRSAGLDRESSMYDVQVRVVRPKSQKVTCPCDGQMGAAYVDCLQGSNVGHASVIISHAWGSSVGDVADTMTQYCKERKLDAKKTFVWICSLSLNQHRLRDSKSAGGPETLEDLRRQHEHHFAGIGNVVVMLSPWNSPVYLGRLWCNLELFQAARRSGTKSGPRLSIVLPPRQLKAFQQALLSEDPQGVESLWRTISHLKIQSAQMDSPEEDRASLLSLIDSAYGCETVNAVMVLRLRRWLLDTSHSYARRQLAAPGSLADLPAARMCLRVGELLLRMFTPAVLECAEHLFQKGRALFQSAGAVETTDSARLLGYLGMTLTRLDRLEAAVEAFAEARRIRSLTGTLATQDGARLLDYAGFARWKSGDLDGTIEVYQEAVQIYSNIGILQTPSGSRLMTFLGLARICNGDVQGATEAQEQAVEIRSKIGEGESLDDAQLLAGIGDGRLHSGDTEGALEALGRSKKVFEAIGDVESPQARTLFKAIAYAEELRDASTISQGDTAENTRVSRSTPARLSASSLATSAAAPDPKVLTLHTPVGASTKRLSDSMTNFRQLMGVNLPRPPSFMPATPPSLIQSVRDDQFDEFAPSTSAGLTGSARVMWPVVTPWMPMDAADADQSTDLVFTPWSSLRRDTTTQRCPSTSESGGHGFPQLPGEPARSPKSSEAADRFSSPAMKHKGKTRRSNDAAPSKFVFPAALPGGYDELRSRFSVSCHSEARDVPGGPVLPPPPVGGAPPPGGSRPCSPSVLAPGEQDDLQLCSPHESPRALG